MALPRPVKIWLISVITIICATIAVALINWGYGWGIILSFYRSEIAMLYWMGRIGISQATTLIITIVCSTLSIANYFWLGNQLEKPVVEWFENNLPWFRSTFGIHVRVVPNKNAGAVNANSKLRAIAKKFPHFIIPLYVFDPIFGVPSGVIFAQSSRINTKTAFTIMALANVAEKILWSYIVQGIAPHLQRILFPVCLTFVVIVITAQFIRFLYVNNQRN